MKVIEPGHEILTSLNSEAILRHLEMCGRVCYKSEHRIAKGSAQDMLKRIIEVGHESVVEHFSVTVKLTVDRGVTHEMVRHRLCSFSQESTRYANYSKEKFGNEITVIRPYFFHPGSNQEKKWITAMKLAEAAYMDLLGMGAKAQEARSVLPNSLKADIVITANLREWRKIFELRCGPAAHPQMRQVMIPLLDEMHKKIPVIFDDLYYTHFGEPAEAYEGDNA